MIKISSLSLLSSVTAFAWATEMISCAECFGKESKWHFQWVTRRSSSEGRGPILTHSSLCVTIFGYSRQIYGSSWGNVSWWGRDGRWWICSGCCIVGTWTTGTVNMYPTSVCGGAIMYYAPSSKMFVLNATLIFVVGNFSNVTIVMRQCDFVRVYYCVCPDINQNPLQISFWIYSWVDGNDSLSKMIDYREHLGSLMYLSAAVPASKGVVECLVASKCCWVHISY